LQIMTSMDEPGDLDLRTPRLSTRRIFQGGYLAVDFSEYGSKDKTGRREIVAVKDGVCILAVMEDGTVPLVRQFRQAVDLVLLELPAGVREKDESPLDAARRELSEEVGAQGGQWTHLLRHAHAEGYSTGWMDLFLAQGCKQGLSHPDPGEDLEVVFLPLEQVLARAESGGFSDAKTLLACAWSARLLPRPA
jgi:ADP-ribose pyrophosphatase